MNFIVTPLVTFIVFMSIYSLFELFVRRRERMVIIEKLGDKLDPACLEGKLNLNLMSGRRFSFGALKAGCLMIGIGLGFLAGFVICSTCVPDYFGTANWHYSDITGIIYGACLFIFGGIGLLVAFLTELKYAHRVK